MPVPSLLERDVCCPTLPSKCDGVRGWAMRGMGRQIGVWHFIENKKVSMTQFDAGLNRPGFRRHLAAINYGLGGGGYEHEAVHR